MTGDLPKFHEIRVEDDKSMEFHWFSYAFEKGSPRDAKVPTAIPHKAPRTSSSPRTRSAQGFGRSGSRQQRFGEQPYVFFVMRVYRSRFLMISGSGSGYLGLQNQAFGKRGVAKTSFSHMLAFC